MKTIVRLPNLLKKNAFTSSTEPSADNVPPMSMLPPETPELTRHERQQGGGVLLQPGAYRVARGGMLQRAGSVNTYHEESSSDLRLSPLPSETPEASTNTNPPATTGDGVPIAFLAEADLVVEAKSKVPLVQATAVSRKRQIAIVLIPLVVVVVIVVGVAVGLTSRQTSASDGALRFITSAPTVAPTPAIDQFLLTALPATTVNRLSDPSSPQFKAYDWAARLNKVPGSREPDHVQRVERTKLRFALATLFYATSATATWEGARGWLDPDLSECEWHGCRCNGSVLESLDLTANNLNGSIPAELGLASSLMSLVLTSNTLNGSIPSNLGNLISLRKLRLSKNAFTGTIPSELGLLYRLQQLDLTSNKLTGPIPSALGNLTNLRAHFLEENLLEGPLPLQLWNLTAMKYLRLNQNQLTGSIPALSHSLTSLRHLSLEANDLSGSLAPSVGMWGILTSLSLVGNSFHGSLPSDLGSLSDLTLLRLSNNRFSGSVPTEIWELPLQDLQLSRNKFIGTLPSSISLRQSSKHYTWITTISMALFHSSLELSRHCRSCWLVPTVIQEPSPLHWVAFPPFPCSPSVAIA